MFRKFAWLLSAMSLFVPFLLSGHVAAAGETYSWKNEQNIEVSGGNAQGTITLKKVGNTSWQANPSFTYSGGCKILSFTITILSGDGSSGLVGANNATINPTSDLCSPEVVSSYNGKTVSIKNVPNRQTNATETADQRKVTVQSSIKTTADAQGGEPTDATALEKSKDQVPKNDEITLKNSDGKTIRTITSEDVTTSGGFFGYKTTFTNIGPGNYQACSKLAEKCESFEKKSGVGKEVTITGANQPIQVNTTADQDSKSCESEGGTLSWIICPLLFLGDKIVDRLDKAITNLLQVPDEYLDDSSVAVATARLRNIAFIILVPIIMVMVISTALGFDFVSAYTVKKALPRMIAATLFIALSFEVCKFLIVLTNNVGQGISGLITSAFAESGNISISSIFHPDGGDSFTAFFGVAGVATAAYAVGSIGILLSYMLVAVIALAIGFFLLSFRQMLIIALLLLAPLAVLSWIFPGNDKLWKLWWQTFSKLLLLYPLIMLLTATGKSFASIVQTTADGNLVNTLIKLVAYIGPYFLIPAMFKFAGGVFGSIAGMANDRGRGIFDRSKKYRGEKAAKNWSDFKAGERKWRPKSFNTLGTRAGAGLSGGFGFTQKGKADIERMRTARQAERIKEPGVQDLLFDDDVRGALMQGNVSDAKKFLDSRVKAGKLTESDAKEKLGAARSVGFDRTSMLTAMNFEAMNKSRNFVDRTNDDGTVTSASDIMKDTVARVAKASGVDGARLLQSYMYAAGTQGGRLDLRADSIDKVASEKFDTRLLQASTADTWTPLAKHNIELLKSDDVNVRKRAGSQLLAMQDSIVGTSEGSRSAFIKVMTAGADEGGGAIVYGGPDSVEVQLARMTGATGEEVEERAKELRATSSTYGSSIPEEMRGGRDDRAKTDGPSI